MVMDVYDCVEKETEAFSFSGSSDIIPSDTLGKETKVGHDSSRSTESNETGSESSHKKATEKGSKKKKGKSAGNAKSASGEIAADDQEYIPTKSKKNQRRGKDTSSHQVSDSKPGAKKDSAKIQEDNLKVPSEEWMLQKIMMLNHDFEEQGTDDPQAILRPLANYMRPKLINCLKERRKAFFTENAERMKRLLDNVQKKVDEDMHNKLKNGIEVDESRNSKSISLSSGERTVIKALAIVEALEGKVSGYFRSTMSSLLRILIKEIAVLKTFAKTLSLKFSVAASGNIHDCSERYDGGEATQILESMIQKLTETYTSGVTALNEVSDIMQKKASSEMEQDEFYNLISNNEAKEIIEDIQNSLGEQRQLLESSTQQQEEVSEASRNMQDSRIQQIMRLQNEIVSIQQVSTDATKELSKHMERVESHFMENTFSAAESTAIMENYLQECIPVNMMTEFLPWLCSFISSDEHLDMRKCLCNIFPKEKLLHQVVFGWLDGVKESDKRCEDNSKALCQNPGAGPVVCQTKTRACACESSRIGKRKYEELSFDITSSSMSCPIDEILIWHNAIKRELNDMAEVARKIQLSGDFSDLSAFNKMLQFIAEVCLFHSIAEDKVIFPAVDAELCFAQEHAEEEIQFDKLSIKKHFHNEEVQVLPLARKHFGPKRQRELLYESLCVMPLKLIECVLPWLVASLSEEEARSFLQNMHMAAPASDSALVTLFTGWACKGVNSINLGVSSLVPAKSLCSLSCSSAPSLNSSLFNWETDLSSADTGCASRPIDNIFKFHKAICKDLDNSYTLDHKQEEKLFEDISSAFSELAKLHECLNINASDDLIGNSVESSDQSETMRKYNGKATELQGICKSIRVSLD
ncbi:hypothetical protein EZV62_004730 [Acer yangbiense]|uniref:Hemerythrin-like domain-containing protein n=1 Tax=Acer yangbiense TaxID=1000413 RepID=A0A5C7IKU0_9ROSI|nr:hypothetical protein EZV62_004730 [Acer yangbiense]